jgi:hypothetical protein
MAYVKIRTDYRKTVFLLGETAMVNGSGGEEKKRDDAGGEAEADEADAGDDSAPENQFTRAEAVQQKPTAGLTMPDSNWRRDMAAETTQRSQPKVRSIGRMRTPKPWK